MAKLRAGSLIKRGANYSLVYKGKWISLKTADIAEAERRAAEFIPGLIDPETEWLEYLVAMGDKARAKLLKRTAATGVEWDNLFARFQQGNKKLTKTQSTLDSYISECNALISWSIENGVRSPQELTHGQAAAYLETRTPDAQHRDCALFKRIYKRLGFMEDVWINHDLDEPEGDRFRRLHKPELIKLLSACKNEHETALIRLGLTCGLRLNDCTAIKSEIMHGSYIETVIKKTARSKPRPVTIPLLPGTLKAVNAIAPDYLGLHRDDTWSKNMTALFRRAGIKGDRQGKASFRSLRATFISLMDGAGISPHITDAITAHAPQGMHGRYAQPSADELMKAVNKAIPDLA